MHSTQKFFYSLLPIPCSLLSQRHPNRPRHLFRLHRVAHIGKMHIPIVQVSVFQHQRMLIVDRDPFAHHALRCQAIAFVDPRIGRLALTES